MSHSSTTSLPESGGGRRKSRPGYELQLALPTELWLVIESLDRRKLPDPHIALHSPPGPRVRVRVRCI